MFSKKQTIAVVAKGKPEELKAAAKRAGLKVVERNPQIVLCHGGDGTLLIAERRFPGVPKLLIRDSMICKNCAYDHPAGEILEKVATGKFTIEEHPKLQAQWKRGEKTMGEFVCTNEFNIRNQLLIQALRFHIYINDAEPLEQELIGDGVVICTPFGSRGYYKSITKSSFEEGIGIGLNNITIKKTGIHTDKTKTVTVKITRMTADFAVDNDPEIKQLEPGDTIVVNASAEKMKLVKIQG